MARWNSQEIATASLGGALIVFFAGATAAVAAGANPPTPLWAAGGAVGGGLLGLLAPTPVSKDMKQAAKNAKKSVLQAAKLSDAEVESSRDHVPKPTAATAPVVESTANATPWGALWGLAVVFVLLLIVAGFLAGGAITPPTSWGNESLQNLTKTIVALASAAGTGVLGLLAPSPKSSSSTS
ncbi:MAG TPA: hypothetical protein VKG38_13350 [Solirubrobacteraceae bacterium]|nr:hypothetical protein [Solirubrobacteraceae bacterium]